MITYPHVPGFPIADIEILQAKTLNDSRTGGGTMYRHGKYYQIDEHFDQE